MRRSQHPMCSLCVLLSCQIKEHERNSHSFLPSCHFSLTKLWVLHPYFEIALPLDHLVTQVLSSMNSSLRDFTLLFLPLESFSLGSSEAILLTSFQTLVGLFFLPVDVLLGSIYPSLVPVSPPLLHASPHVLLPLSIFFLLQKCLHRSS